MRLSASQLKTWAKCAMQGKFKYVDKIIKKSTGSSAMMGTAVIYLGPAFVFLLSIVLAALLTSIALELMIAATGNGDGCFVTGAMTAGTLPLLKYGKFLGGLFFVLGLWFSGDAFLKCLK